MKSIITIGILSLLALVLLTSCQRARTCERLSNKIINQHIKYVSKKYDLQISGVGGGNNGEKVRLAIVAFNLYERASIEEARKLFVLGSQELLNRYNWNEEIHPYLDSDPFTEENIRYSVAFYNKETGSRMLPDSLAYCFIVKNNINYCILSKELGETKRSLNTIYEEPYQEALAIIKQDFPGLLEKEEENTRAAMGIKK